MSRPTDPRLLAMLTAIYCAYRAVRELRRVYREGDR
jgi:hypothetical protein